MEVVVVKQNSNSGSYFEPGSLGSNTDNLEEDLYSIASEFDDRYR